MRATIDKLLALKHFTRKFAMFVSIGSSSDVEGNHSDDESSKRCSDSTGPDNPSDVQVSSLPGRESSNTRATISSSAEKRLNSNRASLSKQDKAAGKIRKR